MTTKDAGFAKDQVIVVKRAEGLKANKTAFKNELIKTSGIVSVSYTETTPGRNFNGLSVDRYPAYRELARLQGCV